MDDLNCFIKCELTGCDGKVLFLTRELHFQHKLETHGITKRDDEGSSYECQNLDCNGNRIFPTFDEFCSHKRSAHGREKLPALEKASQLLPL